jgi:hypothetical protein
MSGTAVEHPEKISLDGIDVFLVMADLQEPGFSVKSVEADRDLLLFELAREGGQFRLAKRQEALEAAKAATSACTHSLENSQDAVDQLQVIVTEHYYGELTVNEADCERKIEIDTLQAPVELRAVADLTVKTLRTINIANLEAAKAAKLEADGCTVFWEPMQGLPEKLEALVTEQQAAYQKAIAVHDDCERKIIINTLEALVKPHVRALHAETVETVEVLQALVLRSKAHLQKATEVQADIERKIEIDTVLLGEYENAVQKQIEVCAQLGKRKRQLAKELFTSEVVLRQVAGTSCSVTEQ